MSGFSETFSDNTIASVYARRGDLAALVEAVTNGAPVDVRNDNGYYPIHEAAFKNHCECLKFLLQQEKTDVNCHTRREGNTALTIAAGKGCIECVRVLLEHGADANLRSFDGISSVFEAVESGSSECVQAIINAGADLAQHHLCRRTPFHEAVFWGKSDIVRLLLKSGADPSAVDGEDKTAAFVACGMGRDICLQLLLDAVDDKQALVNKRNYSGATCFYTACAAASENCLKILLANGADVNICTRTGGHPLCALARSRNLKGNPTGCARLIMPLVDKNMILSSKIDPVWAAAEADNLEMLNLLIEDGYPVDNVTTGDWYFISTVSAKRYLKPLYRKSGMTPLGCAARKWIYNTEIMRKLLDSGAEMQPKDPTIYSPFMLVLLQEESPELLDEFLKRDADLNYIDPNSLVEIPDAFLVFSLPVYRIRLLAMLKAGLKPCVEKWCESKNRTCSGASCDPAQYSFLKEISEKMTRDELEELIWIVLPFLKYGLPTCCNAWVSAFGDQLSDFGACQGTDTPPLLAHLCRITIRDQLSTKQLFTQEWIEKITLPPHLKNYLTYANITDDETGQHCTRRCSETIRFK